MVIYLNHPHLILSLSYANKDNSSFIVIAADRSFYISSIFKWWRYSVESIVLLYERLKHVHLEEYQFHFIIVCYSLPGVSTNKTIFTNAKRNS